MNGMNSINNKVIVTRVQCEGCGACGSSTTEHSPLGAPTLKAFRPPHTTGGLYPSLRALGPLLRPLVQSKNPKNVQNAHFFAFRAK